MSIIEGTQSSGFAADVQDLLVEQDDAIREEMLTAPRVNLKPRQVYDLELLMVGGFAPLEGFLDAQDYYAVLNRMRLSDDTLWPMPIVFDVSREQAASCREGDTVVLCDRFGNPLALFTITSRYAPNKEEEAQAVYGTTDTSHPGVQRLFHETGDVYLGGTVRGLSLPPTYDFADLRYTPQELQEHGMQQGWQTIIGFQTRNPLHRVHVELMRRAAEEYGGRVLIHPAVGMTKEGDIDYITRVRAYRTLYERYTGDFAHLALLPLAMRMAGPREALWHALIRKNYGCTHFIVGRDHAGAKNADGEPFYGPYEAQQLVQEYEDEAGITIVPFRELGYVEEEQRYMPVTETQDHHTVRYVSGSELRRRLRNNEEIPDWVSYPEVLDELRRGIAKEERRGVTIFLTGLSASGKSTVAHVLYSKLLELQDRSITVLDGDIIRQHLSKGLGFSKEDRDANIERIGFVAGEVTKHGGIAICAAIAPYAAARNTNRRRIEEYGTYVEVHVATPLAVCEERDPKGLYQKARAGDIENFTGIDDPYEEPEHPELRIDTTKKTPEACADEIIAYLQERDLV